MSEYVAFLCFGEDLSWKVVEMFFGGEEGEYKEQLKYEVSYCVPCDSARSLMCACARVVYQPDCSWASCPTRK